MESKQVVSPCEALAAEATSQEPSAKTETPKKPRWSFGQTQGVGREFDLPGGGRFKFPLIRLNDGSGYASSSTFETDDEELAGKLRGVAKARKHYVFETTKK